MPRLKQRIAGKSIPIEKFSVHKVKRILEHNTDLVLPALVRSLFIYNVDKWSYNYLWNKKRIEMLRMKSSSVVIWMIAVNVVGTCVCVEWF